MYNPTPYQTQCMNEMFTTEHKCPNQIYEQLWKIC